MYINIDKIPLNKLKAIIESCGWKAQIDTDNYLKKYKSNHLSKMHFLIIHMSFFDSSMPSVI